MRKEAYDIIGMHCAACSSSVERVTRKLPGVSRSEVNLTTGVLSIEYDEGQPVMMAGAAMSMSFISVVGNALRLGRRKLL